jgi:hypothetical protein
MISEKIKVLIGYPYSLEIQRNAGAEQGQINKINPGVIFSKNLT